MEIWASEVTFSKYVYSLTIINELLIASGDAGLLAINKLDGTLI